MTDRIQRAAARIAAARRTGARIALDDDAPRDFAEGFAVQEAAVASLGSRAVGWKILSVANGPDIFAPILASGLVEHGGTWTVKGGEPAGIEVEIAFRMARDVAPGSSAGQILDAVGSAHVVFELCQSRLADPPSVPRHVGLADCVSNAGIVIGDPIAGWREMDLRGVPGRLVVDGRLHKEGKSVDPVHFLSILPAALATRGRRLEAGQTVITGSLVGMNWLTGRHDLEGVIDGCGRVAATLDQS